MNKRYRTHCQLANRGSKYAIHCAIRKYGEENLIVKQIDIGINQEELNEKEISWIYYYDSTHPKKGYNMTFGGDGQLATPETAKKISESHKKRIKLGYTISEETRKKMSESRKGMPAWNKGIKRTWKTGVQFEPGQAPWNKGKELSREHKANMSKARDGKYIGKDNNFYGRKHSKECKEIMRQKKIGVYIGERHPMFGKKHTEETKRKMGEAKQATKTHCIYGHELTDKNTVFRKNKYSIGQVCLICRRGRDRKYNKRRRKIPV